MPVYTDSIQFINDNNGLSMAKWLGVVRQWKSETSNNALGDGIFTMITMAARDTLAVEKEVVFAGLRSGKQTKNVFLISGGSDGSQLRDENVCL
jgi:hypothetical protein